MQIKIPEKPPSADELLDIFSKKKGREHFLDLLPTKANNRTFIQKANKEYYYWDKFKQAFPKDKGDPRLGWLVLKTFRNAQAKSIPILDKSGMEFNYWIPDEILKHLQIVDSLAGGQFIIDEPVLNRSTNEKYLINSLMEEAISSSILEGAVTSREKAKQMLLSGKKPTAYADKMVYNNYLTVRKIASWIERPLTVDLINKIHHTITQGTLKNSSACGRFKNENDPEIVVSDSYGTTLYVPPPINEVQPRMEAFIKFANTDDQEDYIHPVLKAIILHFLLAYIHPFVDGNGRTARALFYWYILKKGYWLTEYVSISKYFLESSTQYAKAYLHTEQDESDLTYFLLYHLKILRRAFNDLKTYITDKQRGIQSFSNAIQELRDLNIRQTMLLQHALRHPYHIYTIQKHKNSHGIMYETARKDLLGLEKEGFMEKIKKGKTFHFVLKKGFENKFKSIGFMNR